MPYTAGDRDALLGGMRVFRLDGRVDPATWETALKPLLSGLARRGAARQPSEQARGERAPSAGGLEGLARAGERALTQIEALEATKARVEADLLAAYAALHTNEEQQLEALPSGSAARSSGRVSTDRIVGEEIALATGVGTGEVARRLVLATAPRRHRRILAALRAGVTTLHRALQVASETAVLSDADVALVEEAVLAPSRDGLPLSQRTFVTRLRRAVASVDPRGADERRAQSRSRRGVFGRLTDDGMGCLTLVTDADAVAAIMDRLDGRARGSRAAGDVRTLDQLRCDLATEALLRGHLEAAQLDGASTPSTSSGAGSAPGSRSSASAAAREPVPGRQQAATGQAETGQAATGQAATGQVATGQAATGQAIGLVWLVVPFEVATGESDAACELPGHGWVTAAHAREIMTRPGSVWRTLPVDVRTGEALSRPTRAYRPTAAMVEHVQAVDGTCRGPGCEVPATRCDLDHETPWPHGPTALGNLYAKHRFHHNVKTEGIWVSHPVAGGGLEWTTLTGRRYVTRPKDWRAALADPPDADPPGADPPDVQPPAADPADTDDRPPF